MSWVSFKFRRQDAGSAMQEVLCRKRSVGSAVQEAPLVRGGVELRVIQFVETYGSSSPRSCST